MKRSRSHGKHAHHGHGRRPGLRRGHKLAAAVVLLLALGWLAWNALLVESDVAEVAVDVPQSGAPTTP